MLVGPKLYQVIKVIEKFGPIGTEELAHIKDTANRIRSKAPEVTDVLECA